MDDGEIGFFGGQTGQVKEAASSESGTGSSASGTSSPITGGFVLGPNGLRDVIGYKQIFSGLLKLLYSTTEIREHIIGLDSTEATPLSQSLKELFMALQNGTEIVDQEIFFEVYEKKHKDNKEDVRRFLSHVITDLDAEFGVASSTNDKPIESLLRGGMRQNFVGVQCGHQGRKVEEFIDLRPEANTGDMESILRKLYTPDLVDVCDTCHEIGDMRDWFDVENWPSLLIVNLFNTRNITPDLFGYEFIGVSMLTSLGYVRTYLKCEHSGCWYLYGVSTERIDVDELAKALNELNSGATFMHRKLFGVEVMPECRQRFHEMAELKKYRYIIFKIVGREIVVEKAVGIQDNVDDYANNSQGAYNEFVQDLKNITKDFQECRYAVFNFKFTGNGEGAAASKMDKIVFFQMCPDGAKFEQRTVYARSAEAIKRKLDPVKLYALQVSDEAELAHEELLKKISGQA